jgi:major membrane immunogen (membrane-anchored lipoprotein)
MKSLKASKISAIILCILFVSCSGKDNLNTTVTDNNSELSIKVDAHKNWKAIHYHQSFVHHVFDSLNIGVNESK